MILFFTTSPSGVGTGTGLFLTLNLTHEMNGKINVESEIEAGSHIKVVFPRHTSVGPIKNGVKVDESKKNVQK